MMHNVSNALNYLVEKIICVLLAAMTVVTFAQVVFRIMHGSLPWSEELSRYMMVYLTFLGLSVGVKRGALIEIEAFMSFFPKSIQRWTAVFVTMLNMAFFYILIRYGIKITMITLRQTSPAMGVKMGYIYASIAIGAALMMLHSLDSLIQSFKRAVDGHE
ncbi:TRAP transporter small permease [Pyramidobacter sp. YE332]|uniref:TRAP transporter small permease n=1 Tax=unclassified Pyramidobacter TaxID=2632171 RepID=UPI00098F4129|nr:MULTISPECIES: TRAP transporter small permease [unclassified Pyramidobacter]WOL39527.1 TRAP transporter small permease [Pyramidobacter sp. YE332]